MMDDITGMVEGMFDSMHENELPRRGSVPSEADFLSMMGKIDANVIYKRDNVRLGPDGTRVYMEGYIEGICDALDLMGWHNLLVDGFVRNYLDVKYLNHYFIYEKDSWRKVFSESLMRYYPEDFVESFMDASFVIGRVGTKKRDMQDVMTA